MRLSGFLMQDTFLIHLLYLFFQRSFSVTRFDSKIIVLARNYRQVENLKRTRPMSFKYELLRSEYGSYRF